MVAHFAPLHQVRAVRDSAPAPAHHTEAVEIFGGDGPVVLTCEHATERLPAPWRWPEADQRLVGTHWAYDLGAADLTYDLQRRLSCAAVLSRFSRLLVDPNRPEGAETLFRDVADGEPVRFNLDLDAEERERRLAGYYRPYHAAADEVVEASSAPIVFSVHTFTPVYEGTKRWMEIGVLYDTHEAISLELGRALHDAGFHVAYNEPWSGKEGLIYSVDRHARSHGREPIEIEVRQDLAVQAEFRWRLVDAIAGWLRER